MGSGRLRYDELATPGRRVRLSLGRLLLLVVANTMAASPAFPTPSPHLDAVTFLAGHWCSPPDADGLVLREQWLPPEEGRMVGVARFLREDRLESFEFSRIEVIDSAGKAPTVVLTPAPSGQRPVPFPLVRSAPGEAVFGNPEHDLPVRIAYRRSEAALEVRVEGPGSRTREWRMEPCEGPPFLLVPLAGTEPSPPRPGTAPPPSPDLIALATWLGEAPVVGIGESVHGSHTLHDLAYRIFVHLALHEGFRVLALEIDQVQAHRLDAWVQGKGEWDDLGALLAGRWWTSQVFYDPPLADLLRWMRSRNRAVEDPADRLHVAGYDMKQPDLAVEEVLAALERVDPEAAELAAALYERALEPGAFGMFPNVTGYATTRTLPLPERQAAERLEVRIGLAAEGGTYGTVGLSVRVPAPEDGSEDGDRAPHAYRRYEVHLADLVAGSPQPLGVLLDPPPGATHCEITVFHRGNGTVTFGVPAVLLDGEPVPVPEDFWVGAEPWKLMAPHLQRMDYRGETPATGGLRVPVDPRLDASLAAARQAEARVAATLEQGGPLTPAERAWARQAARLVTQAVEWRTLAETNRDVFLAENVGWLHRTGFPGRRILAHGHVSHTGRVEERMGDFLSRELGEDYRTVATVAGSGAYRYFGPVATTPADAPLQRYEIDAAAAPRPALRDLAPAPFLFAPRQARSRPAAARWLASAGGMEGPVPDVLIFVDDVEPLRPLEEAP